jgi:RNA-directed DNA polymerase
MTVASKTQLLAETALRGPWTTAKLAARIRSILKLSATGQWIDDLARQLVLVFAANAPRPRAELLSQYLLTNSGWRGFLKKHRRAKLTTHFRPANVPPPGMFPVAGNPETWHIPAFATLGQLSDWLGLTSLELDWFADCAGRLMREDSGRMRHYRYRWIPKPTSGARLLEMPKQRLKEIQRQLLENILDEIPPHDAAHAYCRGRSLATYLTPHAGQKMVIHFDLCDFFTSVRWPAIDALFRTAGYPEPVARLLTGLCLTTTPLDVLRASGTDFEPYCSSRAAALRMAHLPQGAPTSPALANLAAYRLDCRLSGLAQKMALRYTRYADDLVFSGGWPSQRSMSQFQTFVRTILESEGFSMHGNKTCVMTARNSQCVSGVILNEHPNLPRADFDQMRALLFNCVRSGPASQNRDERPHFREHLQGRIAYWTLINPQRGGKLKALFDQIHWN